MNRIWLYLKDYKKEAILAPLFKMLEASFELIVPLVVAGIVDRGIAFHDASYVYKMGLLMAALALIGLTCSLTAQYFSARAAMGFGTGMRNDMFEHINRLSYREIDLLGTPTLVNRMTSDINQVQTGVNLMLRLFLRSPFIVLGAVIMSFTISLKAAWIFVAAVPLISLVIYLIMHVTVPVYKAVQTKLDHISRMTRENHVGARVVRAFGRQKREFEEFTDINEDYTETQIRAGRISALLNPATCVIMNFAIILILWTGGKQVDTGAITTGQVVALVNYMNQILIALVALANLIVAVTKAAASLGRINEVFDTVPSLSDDGNHTQKTIENAPRVEFKDVSFTYAGSRDSAISHVSFKAMPGETIGIIGGTGSGKSSLINLIPRFYDADSGQVLVDGVPVEKYPFSQLRDEIGIVPQRAVLFAGTIRDNMRWGDENASDEEILAALRTAQAMDFVGKLKDGLDHKISQGGTNLSGGQRQRLTIARALTGKTDILILDDSASALDFATDAALRRSIKKDTSGMTVFLVSQRAFSIKNADRILVLDDGELVGNGTHEELMQTCPVYKEICLSQLSEQEAAG